MSDKQPSSTPNKSSSEAGQPALGNANARASTASVQPVPEPLVLEPPPAWLKRTNWLFVLGATLGIIIIAAILGFGLFFSLMTGDTQPAPVQSQSRLVITPSPTPSATPRATPTPIATRFFSISEPTAIPSPVLGGQILILSSASSDTGWVVSEETAVDGAEIIPNHFGDSYLYAGILDGKVYRAAVQFDLSAIPRGTKIYGASLRLTGLRADLLSDTGQGSWQLQILASEIDENWRDHGYKNIHNATVASSFEPITQAQLGEGRVNEFFFTPAQIALLERRILESVRSSSQEVSFRVDGPQAGRDNLFAWDSGVGPASAGIRPELFLNLGPAPENTPPPAYVVITSTPTPENIATAVANSLKSTVEATRIGTATPVPANWVTPLVVTPTPTAQNQATAGAIAEMATAMALTTGVAPPPPNQVTATPTPTFVIITSTPTPENIMTLAANVLQLTAEAEQFGTPTALPPNWVTPFVVTSTPTPESLATLEYQKAVILTTGTPTTLPDNVQTATPTPVYITVEPLASPTPTITPSPTPQPLPAALLGKILFLTDREGATEEERRRAGWRQATPQPEPQPYVYDPQTGELGRLTDIWPYNTAKARESWSADGSYQAYTQLLLWTNIQTDRGNRPTDVLAIHSYDYLYNVEPIVTRMGAGIVYDPVWSPVSDEIAFVATESGNDEIWTINRDGTQPRQLTRNMWEWDKHPTWSPDGQQIIFYSNRTGNRQLWIMNKDGTEQRLLMDWNPYNDWDPIWVKYLEPPPPLERQQDWRFIKPPEENQSGP